MRNQGISDASTVDYLRALKRTQGGAPSVVNRGNAGTGASSIPGPERRTAPRYRCAGSAEFRSENSDYRTWATVTDISRSGCYVEIQATSPPDTAVDMLLDVIGVRVRVKGAVRVTYPFLGMGIAFTEISDEDQSKLDELLLRLSLTPTAPAAASLTKPVEAPLPASEIAAIGDSVAVLNALVQFFQTNDALSRAEFLALLRTSQKTPSGVTL